MASDTVLAWHFSPLDARCRYDGRPIVPSEALTVEGPPVLCERGLHASVSVCDALRYAPGPMLWRVEVGGAVLRGADKIVGTGRTALWGFDASGMLRDFARRCALDVIHLWDAPPVVVQYLRTGDESNRAVAWAAAGAAAGAVAWAAARDAAQAAAGAAARDAVIARQRRRLVSMVYAEARRKAQAGALRGAL